MIKILDLMLPLQIYYCLIFIVYFSIHITCIHIGTVDFTTTMYLYLYVLAILSHASNKYSKFAEPSSLSGVPTANIITSASLYAYL